MFQLPPPGPKPNRKKIHQHHGSKKYIRLPADQKCLQCYPIPKPFLETAFGKIPPEIREKIFKDVLTVGSISPLKDGISVPMTKTKQVPSDRSSETKLTIGPAKPASCLALLQTCRQIYFESSLLFYIMNIMYLSDPKEMLSFLRHIGPVRCDEHRSLHLEDILVPAPFYSQAELDQLRSQGAHTEAVLAGIATRRVDVVHSDAEKAVKLLNKRGNIQKIYLDMRPTQAMQYIGLCEQIPGFENSEIVFESPFRWTVMVQPTDWTKSPWETPSFYRFLHDASTKSHRDMPFYVYCAGNEKYRVEVDIIRDAKA